MKRVFFFFLVTLFLLSGCSQNMLQKENIPDWYLNPPTAEDGVYGTGMATKNTSALAEMSAAQRANGNIAQYLSVFIESMLKDYLREAGIGENAEVTAYTEYVAKSVTQAELKGVRIEKRHKDGNTWYVLAFYDDSRAIKLLQDTAKAEAQKIETLKAQFANQNAQEELEKEIAKRYGEYKK